MGTEMPSHGRRPGNLPAEASSFVGRRRALEEVKRTLAAVRLVSIVGPGGVGKTRLAIRIAHDLARGFRDGAWLIELADVREPALVACRVMAALDLPNQAGGAPLALALSHLRDRQLLLVADSCEHLVTAAADLVREVIAATPEIRVLVTSREPLSVPGEHVVPLGPLDLPRPEAAESLTRLGQNEAVRLFTERAAAASGTFELTSANQAAVADLCRRLDGVPLAIELAAVRTRVLTAGQIVERLDDRFALLTGVSRAALPRHQTLEAAVQWSHDLLTPAEQLLLRELSVFAGRFSLDDIRGVCTAGAGSEAGTLQLLASLVDKSLVMKDDIDGLAWYRLHETMREYARLKLRAAGDEDLLDARHTDHYLERCRRSADESRFRLLAWLGWITVEIDNVRAVLRRCLMRDDASRGIPLAVFLTWYWITRAATEGARWLDDLLGTGRGNPQMRAWAVGIRGFLALRQSDLATARPALAHAAAGAREVGDRALLSQSLALGSIAEHFAGDGTMAARLLGGARAAATGLDDLSTQLTLLQARSLDGFFRGNLDEARSASAEGARLSRQAGDLFTLDIWLMNMGLAALIAGDLESAAPLLEEGLRIARRIDDRLLQWQLIAALGCRVVPSDPRRAAQLLGASERLRAEAGAVVSPILAPLQARAVESLRSTLGARTLDAELLSGRHLARSAALALALDEPAGAAVERDIEVRSSALASRQLEVARLVADGLTNKQIGARLFISERTVEHHVRNSLNKLGLESRTQLATWMASSDDRRPMPKISSHATNTSSPRPPI
jgi:predicted ATPase/DNA-binding CsgD family transcriptional regulator